MSNVIKANILYKLEEKTLTFACYCKYIVSFTVSWLVFPKKFDLLKKKECTNEWTLFVEFKISYVFKKSIKTKRISLLNSCGKGLKWTLQRNNEMDEGEHFKLTYWFSKPKKKKKKKRKKMRRRRRKVLLLKEERWRGTYLQIMAGEEEWSNTEWSSCWKKRYDSAVKKTVVEKMDSLRKEEVWFCSEENRRRKDEFPVERRGMILQWRKLS